MNANLVVTDSVISMKASNLKSNFILLLFHHFFTDDTIMVTIMFSPSSPLHMYHCWKGGVVLKWRTNLGYPYIFTPSLWPSYIVINKFSFKFPQPEYKMCTGVLMNQFQ